MAIYPHSYLYVGEKPETPESIRRKVRVPPDFDALQSIIEKYGMSLTETKDLLKEFTSKIFEQPPPTPIQSIEQPIYPESYMGVEGVQTRTAAERLAAAKESGVATYLTSDEVKELGGTLDEGWMVRLEPDGSVKYISPTGWQMDEEQNFAPPPEFPSELMPQPKTGPEPATIEGRGRPFFTKQEMLDLIATNEQPQAIIERVFGGLAPIEGHYLAVVAQWANANPEEFLKALETEGRNQHTEELVLKLMPDITPDEMTELFGAETPTPTSEFTMWSTAPTSDQEVVRPPVETKGIKLPIFTPAGNYLMFGTELDPQETAAIDAVSVLPTETIKKPSAWKTALGGAVGAATGIELPLWQQMGAAAGALINKYVDRPWEAFILHLVSAPRRDEVTGELMPSKVPQVNQALNDAFKQFGWKAIFSDKVNNIWEDYKASQTPTGKGFMTAAEWLNPTYMIPIGSGFGIAAKVTSKVPLIGKLMEGTAKAVQATERAAALPITKPVELAALGVQKLGVKAGEKLAQMAVAQAAKVAEHTFPLMELPTTERLIQETFADNWMKKVLLVVAKVPPVKKGIGSVLGPHWVVKLDSLVVEDIVAKNAIARAEIIRMGQNAANAKVLELRAIESNPVKLFGFNKQAYSPTMVDRLLPEFKGLPEVGTLEHVFTHPEMYNWGGMERGLAYVTNLHETNTLVLNLLRKEGVEPKNLGDDWWTHRVVTGKVDAEGELTKLRGRPGRGGASLGAKPSYEKHRKFPTMAEGIAAGIIYSRNPEHAISTYIGEAFKKIGDARFEKSVNESLALIGMEGKTPAQIVMETALGVVARREAATQAKTEIDKFEAVIRRSISEKAVPTTQTLKAIERRFPDLGRQFRSLVRHPIESVEELRTFLKWSKQETERLTKALKQTEATRSAEIARAQAEAREPLPDETKLRQAFEVMDYEDRLAYREAMQTRLEEMGKLVWEQQTEYEAVKDFLAQDPVATYRGTLGKRTTSLLSILQRGEWPKTLTQNQAKMLLMGGEIKPNVLTPEGRVRWEYVTDQLADHFKMTEDELINHLKYIAKQKQLLDDLKVFNGMADTRNESIQRILKILDDVDVNPEFIPKVEIDPIRPVPEVVKPPVYVEYQGRYWREIPEGEPQQPGGFFRMDLQTGKNYVEVLEAEYRQGISAEAVKPAATAAEVTTKEPWQMTRAEYLKSQQLETFEQDYLKQFNQDIAKQPPEFSQQLFDEVGNGKPGMSITRTTNTEVKGPPQDEIVFVFRDTSGKPVGVARVTEFNNLYGEKNSTIDFLALDKKRGLLAGKAIKAMKEALESQNIKLKPRYGGTSQDALAMHHKFQVGEASKQGKFVPPEVLKDYPELQGMAKPATPEAPPVAKVTPVQIPRQEFIKQIERDFPGTSIDINEKNLLDMYAGEERHITINPQGMSENDIRASILHELGHHKQYAEQEIFHPSLYERFSKDTAIELEAWQLAINKAPQYGVDISADTIKRLSPRLKPEQLDAITKVTPITEPGMPEAGMQADLFGYAKPYVPKGQGKVTQISMDDYNKLVELRKKAGLPPPEAAVKPQIEGVPGLEGESRIVRITRDAPEPMTEAERIAKLKALHNEVKAMLSERKAEYWQARSAYTRQIELARQPGIEQGYIMQPMFGGKIYDREFVDAVNQFFGYEKGNAVLKFTADVAGILRVTKAALDFSAMAIQGLPAWGLAHAYMLADPKTGARMMGAWYKALAYSTANFFHPDIFYQYMAKNQDLILRRVSLGGSTQAVDFFEALQAKGGLGGLFEKATEKIPLTPYQRAELSFLSAGEYVRDAFFQIMEKKAVAKGQEFQLVKFLDNLTGISSTEGISLTVRQLEQSFAWFAPRYTRACLTVLADIFRGGLTGAEARKAIGGLIGAGAAYYSGTQFAVSKLMGESDEDALQDVIEGFGVMTDPITGEVTWHPSGRMMTLKVGNYYMGLGGFYYGLLRLAGNIVETVNQTGDRERIDLIRILKHGSFNKQDNPFIAWWYGRSSSFFTFILEAGGALVKSALGGDLIPSRDFLGYPLETPGDYARYMATQFEPIWMEQTINPYIPLLAADNEIPEGVARAVVPVGELFGARTFPESSWTKFYDKANEYIARIPQEELDPKQVKAWQKGKLGWAQLTDMQKTTLLSRYPELNDFYNVAQGDSAVRDSSIWREWQGRTDEERTVYQQRLDELTKQLQAGEIDTKTYRDKAGEAGQNYGSIIDSLERDPKYASIYDYFDSKNAEGPKYGFTDSLALAEYESQILYAEDLNKANGDYDWEERDRRTETFIEKWGQDVYDKIRAYRSTEKKMAGTAPIWIRKGEDTEALGREYWRLPYKPISEMDATDLANGDVPAQYLSQWQAYQSLKTDVEKETFIEGNPDFGKDWRLEYRAANPEADARLALWGYGGRVQTKAAYDLVEKWGKELGIPLDSMGLGMPPRNLVDSFFEYEQVRRQYGSNSLDAKLYRLAHPDFETWGEETYGWKEPDVSKLPTKEVKSLYDQYNNLPTTGKDRLKFRHEHPELESWLVETKGLTPVGDRWIEK